MTEINETNVKSLKRRMSEMSSKQRLKVALRLLIIFVCVFGLVFQTSQLVYQYTRGQTVVNINFETIKYNRIPAITLCYPQFLSFERVRQKVPGFESRLNETKEQLKNVTESKDRVQGLSDFVTDFVENLEFSVKELFELSIPFELTTNSSSNSSSKPIEIKVKGIRLNKNGSLNEFEIEDREPIESIVFSNGRQGFKCFTFFHHLNKNLRKYQMDVKEITIQVRNEISCNLDIYHVYILT